MKKIVTIMIILMGNLGWGQYPIFDWAIGIGNTNLNVGEYVGIDESGNIYIAGKFSGTVDFDPDTSVNYCTSTGSNNIFVAKYTSTGQLVWVWCHQGNSNGNSFHFDVDPLGNMHILTNSVSSSYINSETDSSKAPILTFTYQYIKLESNGINSLTKTLLSYSSYGWTPTTFALRGDNSGNAYVSVRQVEINGTTMNINVCKIENGTISWTLNYGPFYSTKITTIYIDNDGYQYFSGTFYGTVDFDPGPGIVELSSINGSHFVCKFTPSHDLLWAKNFLKTSTTISSMVTDTSKNLYIAGSFEDTIDFDPDTNLIHNISSTGNMDMFVLKLDSAGNFAWAKGIGGIQSDIITGLRYNADETIYLLGSFSDTVDFDPGPDTLYLNSTGMDDKVFINLDLDGNLNDVYFLDVSNNYTCNAIDIDISGSIASTGYFSGTADFDPGQGTYLISCVGWSNIFLSTYTFSDTLNANFYVSQNNAFIGDTINYNDISTGSPNSWLWDFGDGTTNSLQFPSHTYLDTGTYTICLIVADNFEIDSLILNDNITILPIEADFESSTNYVNFDESVQFTDLTKGNPIFWLWDFGDGTTDTIQNPVHSYQSSGYHIVSLIVSDGLTCDTIIHTDYIWVNPQVPNPFCEGVLLLNTPSYSYSYARISSMAVDQDKSVFAGGILDGKIDIDPGSGVSQLSSVGQTDPDILIAKISSIGELDWADNIGYSGDERSNSIDIDQSGNVYISGHFEGTVDFDPGPGEYNLTTQGRAICIIKYTTTGALVWAKAVVGTGSGKPLHLDIDSTGNVYTTGYFNGTLDFDPDTSIFELTSNARDIFILKIDTNGEFIWGKQIGGSGYDLGQSLSLDHIGNVYVAGSFSGSVDFNPGAGIDNIHDSHGSSFVLKLDNSGNYQWARPFKVSFGSIENSIMDIDSSGNILLSGHFTNTIDIDPGYGTYNLSSNGAYDVVIYKLDTSGNVIWARTIGANLNDWTISLSSDTEGNIYSIMKFENTVDFDPGPDNYFLSSQVYGAYCIVKLDHSGDFVWASSISGIPTFLTLDDNQDIHVSGNYSAGTVFSTGQNTYNTNSSGLYILKYSQQFKVNFLSYNPNTYLGDTTHFRDITTGYPSNWHWNFGDGDTSNIQNPWHLYENPGTYTVVLEAWNDTEYDSLLISNYIIVDSISADFLTSEISIALGDTIWFYNQSHGSQLIMLWDFGDGSFSSVQNPIHIYQNPGIYTVSLTINHGSYFDTLIQQDYITVHTIMADFSSSDSLISVGDTIHFSDLSLGTPNNWFWDFGDGNSDTSQNPTHAYQDTGTYSVTLIINIGSYFDTLTFDNYIHVQEYHANFTASDQFVMIGNSVQFTDLTVGIPNYWLWDFGDGETSLNQNPSHAYQDTGFYTVSLLTANQTDTSFFECSDYIKVIPNPVFPGWFYTNTGQNHTILVPTGSVSVDGQYLGPGDIIGVFYIADNGLLECGGYTAINIQNQSVVVSAWGDDNSTPQKDGFASGEEFQWKVYRVSENTNYNAIATYMTTMPHGGSYITNGMSGINSLITITGWYQTIELFQSWNIISTYIDPQENNLDSIFDLVINELILMKDENANVYWPSFGINGIDSLVIGKAYQIKMASQQTLTISGTQIDPASTPLSLPTGWSLLGYLRDTPGDITALLSSIASETIMVKDGDGAVYWPQFGINQIGNMQPGKGYQIKMNSAQTFTYPANSANMKTAAQTAITSSRQIKNTGNNMTLGLPASEFEAGEEILVFSKSGLLVGASVVQDDFTAITTWGDDETTPEIDGLQDNEEFIIQLGNGEILTIDNWIEGDNHYQTNKIAVASSRIEFPFTNFILYQNIPNPFTGETEFSFYLPVECHVQFEIFNILGDRVWEMPSITETRHALSLQATPMPPGKHSLKFDAKHLPAGTYFFRLKTSGFEKTRKMIIM